MNRMFVVALLVLSGLAWSGSLASAEEESPATSEAPATTAAAESNPCLDPGYACGWAVVEPDGSVSNVIVCTFEVCGSGSFGGMRTVLQTRQTEGGNVAGWRDSVYNEETNTFELPGGGTIRGGDFIENAVFPTTSVAVTFPPQEDGQTIEEYLESETDVVVTSSAVSYQVPVITGAPVAYTVEFDPAGPAPAIEVQSGEVRSEISAQSASSRTHARILVSLKSVGARQGKLTLSLTLDRQALASIDTKIMSVRKYSSCVQLRADFPGGIRASRAATDKVKGKSVQFRSVRPVVSPALFRANAALDRDRDRVLCERS